MNQQIFYLINNIALKNIYLDAFIIFLAKFLPYLLIVIFSLFFSYYFFIDIDRRKLLVKKFLFIITSTFVIFGISQIINYLYFSPRPFLVLSDVNLLFPYGANESFPSGHTTFFFALAFLNYFYGLRKLNCTLFMGAILIGLARVVSGVHWPYDILGAFIVSWIGVFLIRFLLKKFNFEKYIA